MILIFLIIRNILLFFSHILEMEIKRVGYLDSKMSCPFYRYTRLYNNNFHNVLATSFIICIIHGRVSTDHAPYRKDTLEFKLEGGGGGRLDWN